VSFFWHQKEQAKANMLMYLLIESGLFNWDSMGEIETIMEDRPKLSLESTALFL